MVNWGQPHLKERDVDVQEVVEAALNDGLMTDEEAMAYADHPLSEVLAAVEERLTERANGSGRQWARR